MYVASELKLAKNPMGHVPNLILKAVLDVSCHNDGRCHLLSADLIFFQIPSLLTTKVMILPLSLSAISIKTCALTVGRVAKRFLYQGKAFPFCLRPNLIILTK